MLTPDMGNSHIRQLILKPVLFDYITQSLKASLSYKPNKSSSKAEWGNPCLAGTPDFSHPTFSFKLFVFFDNFSELCTQIM